MRYFVLFMVSLLLLSCGNSKKEASSKTASANPDEVLAQKAALQLINDFSRNLKGELLSAMKAGGAMKAIEVCQKKAPYITSTHSNLPIWSIRRVSEKNRNPENKATPEEQNILARFADSTQSKTTFVSEWQETDSGKVFYYYKPIRVGGLCLQCHGPYEKLEPTVKAVLKDRYPNDQATGYKVGDLRGMFVVTMKWPDAKDFARELIADTVFRR